MLRNYVIVALRHFRKNHVTSFINMLGLTIGLATCLVAGLYIKHDLMADKFHENARSIFRVTVKMREFTMTGTPYLFAETAAREIPEVEGILRTSDVESTVKINNELFRHSVLYADTNFLTFFTFPLSEGDRSTALNGLRQVVLSHEMKERYFPDASALGERISIQVDNKLEDFEVSGVARPTPSYSSMYFDFVIPLENRYVANKEEKDDWGRFLLTTFIKLPPSKEKAFDNAMPAFVKKHFASEQGAAQYSTTFVLNNYADHYLGEQFGGGGLRNGKSKQSLTVFGGIAVVILLLACFNFMNLANARASKRAVEIGVKKVIGAGRSQLVRQFLAEALVVSFLASFLALGLAELCLFIFRDLLQTNLSFFNQNNGDIFAGLFAATVFTGIMAGLYPAFVLSNIETLKTFRRDYKVGGSNWITKLILSFQFCVSIVLIVCAIVMWKQQKFVSSSDLGFNREQLVAIKIPENQLAMIDVLKNKMKEIPEIVQLTKTTTNFNGQTNIMHQRGRDGNTSFVYMISADEDFISTMQMTLSQGEGFKEGQPQNSIMVNETLLKDFELQDSVGVPLGRMIAGTSNPVIVGVVKDFHHSALKFRIGQMAIVYNQPMGEGYLLARLAPQQIKTGIEKIKTLWQSAVPDAPVEISFVDDNVRKQYEAEARWSGIITLATAMAIFLSVLGLLGLAMFTSEQRKKEIGIRKVMGASTVQLVNMLSRDYLWLILSAFAVAAPISWFVMTNYWLKAFTYKTTIDFAVYVVALVVVFVIAGISIGSQTFRAALQNPAETLKTE